MGRKIKTILFIIFSINLYCQNNEFVDKNKSIYIEYPKDWNKNEEIGVKSGTNVIVAFIQPENLTFNQSTFTITVSKIENNNFDKNDIDETEKQFKEYIKNYELLKLEKIQFANSNALIREYCSSKTNDAQKKYTKQIEVRKDNYSYILSFNCALDLLPNYKQIMDEIYNSFEFLSFTSKNCKDLTNGKFFYSLNNTNNYIENSEEFQTEIGIKENLKIVSKKKWVSDCEYDLEVTETSHSNNFPTGSTLNIKIVDVTKNGYTYIWETLNGRGRNKLIKK